MPREMQNIERSIGRVVASLVGLLLLAAIGCRICRWWAGSSVYATFLGAVAGRPIVRGRGNWDYGLWELCPDGQLVGVATIVLVVALLGGAIMNRSSLYCVAGGVIACGYLVNAYLFLKLMAAY